MIDKRFPNWDVDIEKGTVYSLKLKRIIGRNGKNGYLRVNDVLIHHLVWMVANQVEIPDNYVIHHIDENKHNNSIYNLELMTKENHIKHHHKGKIVKDSTKQLISSKNKGKQSWIKGKHHSDKVKEKLSIVNKGQIPWNKGIKHDEETRNRIYSKLRKQVAQYTLDGKLVKIWESTLECKNNNYYGVADCCRGERKTRYGFIWKYYKEEKDVA